MKNLDGKAARLGLAMGTGSGCSGGAKIMEKRETANYRQPRFTEPICGAEFDQVIKDGLRPSINAYLKDPSFSYVFDPDHAMIAYPLRVLTIIGSELTSAGVPLEANPNEEKFIQMNVRDKTGSLSTLLAELKRLGVVG
jgi:hypothetical protein